MFQVEFGSKHTLPKIFQDISPPVSNGQGCRLRIVNNAHLSSITVQCNGFSMTTSQLITRQSVVSSPIVSPIMGPMSDT